MVLHRLISIISINHKFSINIHNHCSAPKHYHALATVAATNACKWQQQYIGNSRFSTTSTTSTTSTQPPTHGVNPLHSSPQPPQHAGVEEAHTNTNKKRVWTDFRTHRQFFDEIAKDLGITKLDDWYNITGRQIKQRFSGGYALLGDYYGGSLYNALSAVYPEHEWLPWRFPRAPTGFWLNPAHVRRFFDHLARDLNVQHLDDWYHVKRSSLSNNSKIPASVWDMHGSLPRALMFAYPEHEWDVAKFKYSRIATAAAPAAAAAATTTKTTTTSYVHPTAAKTNTSPPRPRPRPLQTEETTATTTTTTTTTTEVTTFEQLEEAYGIGTTPEEWRKVRVPAQFWDDTRNQRLFFDRLALALGVKQMPHDWYSLAKRGSKVSNKIPRAILNRYGKSWRRALQHLYPEYSWSLEFVKPNIMNELSPLRIRRLSNHRAAAAAAATDEHKMTTTTTTTTAPATTTTTKAADAHAHRIAFDHLAKQLGVRRWPEDWYGVTRQQVLQHGTVYRYLLSERVYGSLHRALSELYPEYRPWLPWKFKPGAPVGFWSDINGRKLLFDHIASEVGVKHLDDWYNVDHATVAAMTPAGLLKRYSGSWQRALMDTYPHHAWNLPLLLRTSAGALERKKKSMPSLQRILRKHAIRRPSDWAQRCTTDNARRAIMVPAGFWAAHENQRAYFDWLGRHLGIRQLSDWYAVDPRAEQVYVPHGILVQHGHSLVHALRAAYPEHPWQVWRFEHCNIPRRAWEDDHDTLLRDYVSYLAEELRITEHNLDDWYRVSMEQISRLGGASLVSRNGGLYELLKRAYPHHPWQASRFESTCGKRSAQRWLLLQVQRLFPNNKDIKEEYCMTPEHIHNNNNNNKETNHASEHQQQQQQQQQQVQSLTTAMRLDIFIPSLSLAFEYHGKQHYTDVYFFRPQHEIRRRDQEKSAACERAGITLVVVPYWWDNSVERLAATVAHARPDLIPLMARSGYAATGDPIPTTPPPPPPTTTSSSHIQQHHFHSNNNNNSSSSNNNNDKGTSVTLHTTRAVD